MAVCQHPADLKETAGALDDSKLEKSFLRPGSSVGAHLVPELNQILKNFWWFHVVVFADM